MQISRIPIRPPECTYTSQPADKGLHTVCHVVYWSPPIIFWPKPTSKTNIQQGGRCAGVPGQAPTNSVYSHSESLLKTELQGSAPCAQALNTAKIIPPNSTNCVCIQTQIVFAHTLSTTEMLLSGMSGPALLLLGFWSIAGWWTSFTNVSNR